MKCKFKKPTFIQLFLPAALTVAGLFHEFAACAAGIALAVCLAVSCGKDKKLVYYKNEAFEAVCLIALSYALSAFWAVDAGAAVTGFFKFLPLLLFALAAMRDGEDTDACLGVLPHYAAAVTAISAVLMQVPALSRYFSVAGRLAGFFQYSNTFALLLLAALIVELSKEKAAWYDFVTLTVLLFGIGYSGSRTVFVLTALSLLALLIFGKNRKRTAVFASAAALLALAAAVYAHLRGGEGIFGRILRFSFRESSFVGRLLYAQDALPLVLKHPFGLGYLGYNFAQGEVQTGVYTTRFVHNDFLQLALDIGWIPLAAFVFAVVKAFFKKGAPFHKRLLIFVMAAHAVLDFDFQYVAVFMLFLLLLDLKGGKRKELRLPAGGAVAAAAMSLLFAYVGTAQGLIYFKRYAAAETIYPWDTKLCAELMAQSADMSEKEKYADKIIKSNDKVWMAHETKAFAAFSDGNFDCVIESMETALKTSPFTYKLYEDYCAMLIRGIGLYEKAGDANSAAFCREKLLQTADRLEKLPEKLSPLGRMIRDQPKTDLPAETAEYINALKSG